MESTSNSPYYPNYSAKSRSNHIDSNSNATNKRNFYPSDDENNNSNVSNKKKRETPIIEAFQQVKEMQNLLERSLSTLNSKLTEKSISIVKNSTQATLEISRNLELTIFQMQQTADISNNNSVQTSTDKQWDDSEYIAKLKQAYQQKEYAFFRQIVDQIAASKPELLDNIRVQNILEMTFNQPEWADCKMTVVCQDKTIEVFVIRSILFERLLF